MIFYYTSTLCLKEITGRNNEKLINLWLILWLFVLGLAFFLKEEIFSYDLMVTIFYISYKKKPEQFFLFSGINFKCIS